MALVLITGPIWAKPAWGHYWPWEPRLTTSLVLFLTYMGYFMIREYGGNPEQTSKYSAVVSIIAFLNVPLIFISVKFWLPEMQSHPQVGQYFSSNNLLPTYLIIFSLLVTSPFHSLNSHPVSATAVNSNIVPLLCSVLSVIPG